MQRLPAGPGLAPTCTALRPAPPRSNVWLTSEQHLDLNFNPASLLSVGDALAFMRSAQREWGRPCSTGGGGGS